MKPGSLIRVLVADDSALMRNLITRLLERAEDLEVIATARDGEDAFKKTVELKPDVVTMDINMPKLDGISAMQMIVAERICPVIMFSSLTQHGALETFECLQLGAFDFVPKPDGTVSANLDVVGPDLICKVRAAATAGVGRRPLFRPAVAAGRSAPRVPQAVDVPPEQLHAIAIGISTGGPTTISTLLPELPANLPAAIFLVQHMPALFIKAYVARLQNECAIQVVEAESGAVVRAGHCYVAGNDLHLGVYRKRNGEVVLRTPNLPKTLFMPGVDVMMESVLAAFGDRTIGVLMTGIGDDGADQMVNIRKAGGTTIAESQESCVVFGMPYQAIKRGGAEFVLPSWEMAKKLVRILESRNTQAGNGERRSVANLVGHGVGS
jgi:two-component system chemotaxis response regulator CheB